MFANNKKPPEIDKIWKKSYLAKSLYYIFIYDIYYINFYLVLYYKNNIMFIIFENLIIIYIITIYNNIIILLPLVNGKSTND